MVKRAGFLPGLVTNKLPKPALSAVTIFVLLVLWAALLSAAPASGDLAAILERRKIVVAMTTDDQRPFFMAGPDGTLTGLDADMAAEIAGELGVKLEINRSAKSFNDTVDLVARGEADVAISKLSCTLSRGKKVIFTRPYLVLRKALLVNRMAASRLRGKRRLPDFIQQLRGRIGVIGGSSYVGFAQQMFSGAKVIEYASWDEVVAAVKKGEVLAAFRDELEVKKVILLDPKARLTLHAVVFKDSRDPIAMAVHDESPHLLAWLNQYLSLRPAELTVDGILDRYKNVLVAGPKNP